LKTVVVELFLYNFLGQGQEHSPKDFKDFLLNTANLFVSADTLWASAQTVSHNLMIKRPAYEIKPGGFFYYPPGHNAKGPFDGYPAGIWKLHETRKDGMKLHQPAFDAVREIIELCRQHNLELIFVLTPNHAYDDYYLETIGAWPTIEEWLSRLAKEPARILSFSQPNPLVYEEVSEQMRYWYDPYHFSLEMGKEILKALSGQQTETGPIRFMEELNPVTAKSNVEMRRLYIKKWAKEHDAFILKLEEEKRIYERLE
jgi:hypothetical protein